MKNFKELGVSPEIRKAIEEMGYENPMPVQEKVIPYLLGEDQDLVALAQTGTGKTAAFGLPLIDKVDLSNNNPQSLILCPTRELCLQIADDLNDYSKFKQGIHVLAVYGGASIEPQIKALRRGVHIIVATPGRLIDLMQRRAVSLKTIKNVVMDEADEMLNMGFTDSINTILEQVPTGRQTLLFSATMSPEVAKIAKNYLHNAKEIVIGRKNESTANVEHIAYTVQAKDKYEALKRIVDFYPHIYGIIFCRTRRETQEIADKLMQEGYSADTLHGELSQAQRDAVMQKFRLKTIQLLVATDVAARGLDVDDLTHVINYGLPDDTESYTHRSGRTGRAGKTGISIAIINLREKGKLREIEKIIGKNFSREELPTGDAICAKQLMKVIDEIQNVAVDEKEIERFLPEAYAKLAILSKEELIKRIVSMQFNHFLAYYKNKSDLFTPTEGKQARERASNGRRAEEGYSRLFISLGKTDNLIPGRLIDLINQYTDKRLDIGRIDVLRNFSFFEVKEEETSYLLKALGRAKWNGRKVVVEVAGDNDSGHKKRRKASRAARGYTRARGPLKRR